jgi:hypothetical protein
MVGSARIVHIPMPPGRYWMNGLYGPWQYVETEHECAVTHLQTINRDGEWQTWMVDDPTHWLGLQVYGKRIQGPEVFVGGLGLGLIVHLLATRDDLHVTIIERNLDVIRMIRPLLPPGDRLTIIHDDAWARLDRTQGSGFYRTIFLDLWRGPIAGQVPEVIEKARQVHAWHPQADLLCFWFSELVDRELLPSQEEAMRS